MQLAALLFQIQCIPFMFIVVLPTNLQYKLDYGCWLHYLLYQLGKNQKLCWSLPKIASEIAFFPHTKRKFMSLKGEMNAEFNDIDSLVFWCHRNTSFSLWTVDRTHYSWTCIPVLAHATHKRSIKRPYSQMCMPSGFKKDRTSISFLYKHDYL